MRILGLDPGPTETAYCLIDEGYTVLMAGKTETAVILEALTTAPPNEVVVESIQSYGMIVGRAVFDTCYTIGRILQTCDNVGIRWTLYPRPEYTKRICGVGKINDAILRRALEMRFGGYGEVKSEEVIPDGEPGAGAYKGGPRKGQPRRREIRIPEPLFHLAGNSDKRSAFAVAVYHLDILKGGGSTMIPETAWLLGLGIAFLSGILIGYAYKARTHEKEIDGILAFTANKETPRETRPPGRAGRLTDPSREIRSIPFSDGMPRY